MRRMIRMEYKFLLLFVALMMLASQVQADSKPIVIVSSFTTEGKAMPGNDFTLSVKLSSIQPGWCANTLVTSVSAGFPFIMNGVSNFYTGDLCTPDSATIEIPLRIDPSANGGFYQITLISSYQTSTGAQYSSSSTLNVFVDGSPDIKASIVGSQPDKLFPGDSGVITVNLENKGAFQAASLTAALSASSPIIVKPLESFSSIGLLTPKSSRTAEYSIEIPKDAASKAYPLSLALSYLDENLKQQNKTFTLNLEVSKKARFEASGTNIFYSNQKGKSATIILKNMGTDAAENAHIRIMPMFPFSTDGSARFASNIATGQSVPVQFTLDVDKDAQPGDYALDVLIDYEDGTGNKFQDTTQIALSVRKSNILRTIFFGYWFLWLIILVAAFLIMRKRMHKKH
jgi:hypothetical protein